jgi:hypothetical protein
MTEKIHRIHLRRPKKDEIEHVSSTRQVYGPEDEQKENRCTQFANFWGCAPCDLCSFMILYAIMLAVFVVLLCLRLFLNPSLPGIPDWMLVMLPLGLLVYSIVFSICCDSKCYCHQDQVKQAGACDMKHCPASCLCRTLWVVVLLLIGWGLGVLELYLDDSVSLSWGERILRGLPINLAWFLGAVFLIGIWSCLSFLCLGKWCFLPNSMMNPNEILTF